MYIMCVLKAFNCVLCPLVEDCVSVRVQCVIAASLLCPLVEDSVSVINRLAEEETGEVCVCYCVCVYVCVM